MIWIIILLMVITITLLNINRKVSKMATVIEVVQNFLATISTDLDNIQADIIKLQELVTQGGDPVEIQTLLQGILDRTNAIKNIEP